MPLTLDEIAAEHARAMRLVGAVLAACDPRVATAKSAREHGMTRTDGRWVLAIGKAAIGMAEGLADVCGTPDRHLIVTVDGVPAISLRDVVRSDHPLPTPRSLDAGRAVRRFIEEARNSNASALTVLISGGASSLICEPIPGIELDEYRDVVRSMLQGGWDIQKTNAVRRAIDALKGGGLCELAHPLPIDMLVVSDVLGNTLQDVGSGPFVWSTTTTDDAARLIRSLPPFRGIQAVLTALSCRVHPRGFDPPRRAVVVLDNADAVRAGCEALGREGFNHVKERYDVRQDAEEASWSATASIHMLKQGEAFVWGGEWPFDRAPGDSVGGRCQALALMVHGQAPRTCVLAFATDGVDGRPAPGCPQAAGAFLSEGMTWPPVSKSGAAHASYARALAADPGDPDWAGYRWQIANSYHVLAHRDRCRRAGEPAAHIFTGPTGTNANDLLIVWRV